MRLTRGRTAYAVTLPGHIAGRGIWKPNRVSDGDRLRLPLTAVVRPAAPSG